MSTPEHIPAPQQTSPPWGPTAKLVAGLSFMALVAAFLINFRNLIGPLLLAFILAYVLHPLISWLNQVTRFAWRANVNLVYLVMIVLLVGLFTVTGIALVEQAQNLVGAVQRFINDLPQLVTDLSTLVYTIGPFTLDFSQFFGQFDLNSLLDQILGIVQPLLGQAGSLVSALASGTISTLGWGMFILLVSYFTLADAGQVPDYMASVEIPPAYAPDLRRLGRQLGRIWNAFMRGQLMLFTITVISAFIVLSALGVRNSLALALLSGLARFVPYIGPFITWSVTGVVAFLQPSNYFGAVPLTYTIIVLVAIIILDQIFDNIVTPRLYGQVLGVHPAAVLVAAIIAANLIGFIGLLVAAPVLATFVLFGRYAIRKMFDTDPWPEPEPEKTKVEFPGAAVLRNWWGKMRARAKTQEQEKKDE